MILTEIDHIAIAVHDLESAISYYKDAFGACLLYTSPSPRDRG